jgi:hypothetical protein
MDNVREYTLVHVKAREKLQFVVSLIWFVVVVFTQRQPYILDTDKNPCTIDVCENKKCVRMSAPEGGQCDDQVSSIVVDRLGLTALIVCFHESIERMYIE